MTLSDEIRALIEQIPPRSSEEETRLHNRWMLLSGRETPEPDYLPLIVTGIDREKRWEWKRALHSGSARFPLAEQMDDPAKMLYEQLLRVVPTRRFPGDASPAVAPFFGNAFLLSGLGLETRVMGDCLEPARSLSREEARRLELAPDLARAGLIGKAVRFVQFARATLPAHIPVGLAFMMSAYDLAYLVRGPELMLDMYDAPEDVHRLMRRCAEVFVQATQLLKREAGEPADFHRYASATAVGGALSCEDCCVMLSGDLHREFAIPYTRQTLDALGGGWVHFCGDGRRLLDDYLAIPSLHGIFFGQLHLNGPMHETALKLISHGKALNYIPGGGYTPSARPGFAPARAKAESWPDFFRRVLEPFDRKKGIYLTAFAFTDDAKTGESLLRLWHEAQDARFG